MDVVDMAHDREEADRAAAIKKACVKPGKNVSNWFCDDCLEGIPAARREAVQGCTRCVDCQEIAEQKGLA